MNKSKLLVFLAAITLVLVGCSKEESTNVPALSDQQQSATAASDVINGLNSQAATGQATAPQQAATPVIPQAPQEAAAAAPQALPAVDPQVQPPMQAAPAPVQQNAVVPQAPQGSAVPAGDSNVVAAPAPVNSYPATGTSTAAAVATPAMAPVSGPQSPSVGSAQLAAPAPMSAGDVNSVNDQQNVVDSGTIAAKPAGTAVDED